MTYDEERTRILAYIDTLDAELRELINEYDLDAVTALFAMVAGDRPALRIVLEQNRARQQHLTLTRLAKEERRRRQIRRWRARRWSRGEIAA